MHKRYISQFLVELYAESILQSCNEYGSLHSQKSILYALEKMDATASVTSAIVAVRRELSMPVLIQVYSLDGWDISRTDYGALLRAGVFWVNTPHGYNFWNHVYQMVISRYIEANQVACCFGEQDMLQYLLST